MLTAITVLIILAVGYAHMRDGMFTALCMLINAIVAGIVAFGFFEPVAEWLEGTLQGGFFANYEDFLALVLIFAGTLAVLRMITNRLAPEILDLPANFQYGGALFGLITGYFVSGFLICAMQTLPWHENFFDFQPRVSNDSGPRSLFPPDRLWLAMMRYIGAHSLAWEEDDQLAENRYDRYKTFDRYATFEQRYLRYRRFGDIRAPLKYQLELERELYKLQWWELSMLVVMQRHATLEQVAQAVQAIRDLNLTPHPMPGATRTAIGITGNISAVDPRPLEVLPGVAELIRVTKPFKLASREMHEADTVVPLPMSRVGPGTFTLIAGPCSVENEAMILKTAEHLMSRGVKLMRAGAFKPRTSPYSFQGMGLEGLKILQKARAQTGIGIVTELMDTDNADAVEDAADIIQIGTRNMQNFSLLKRVAKARKPVLLKRGMSATLEDWLMAAEYVMAGGNYHVILCERGVRTFSDHSRNTLDLSVIPPAKKLSHLPIVVDPSHGTGKRDYVPAMALASLAAGADGLLLEVHPDPDHAQSDGAQTLDFAGFDKLLASLRKLAAPLEKSIN